MYDERTTLAPHIAEAMLPILAVTAGTIVTGVCRASTCTALAPRPPQALNSRVRICGRGGVCGRAHRCKQKKRLAFRTGSAFSKIRSPGDGSPVTAAASRRREPTERWLACGAKIENMNKLGVYGWIRENVRRAVLLGFSDAVEQLGLPSEKEEISPQLLAVLRPAKPALTAEPQVAKPATGGTGRKRLGQTLEQIQQRAAAPATEAGNESKAA